MCHLLPQNRKYGLNLPCSQDDRLQKIKHVRSKQNCKTITCHMTTIRLLLFISIKLWFISKTTMITCNWSSLWIYNAHITLKVETLYLTLYTSSLNLFGCLDVLIRSDYMTLNVIVIQYIGSSPTTKLDFWVTITEHSRNLVTVSLFIFPFYNMFIQTLQSTMAFSNNNYYINSS